MSKQSLREKWAATFKGDFYHVDRQSSLAQMEEDGDLAIFYSRVTDNNPLGRGGQWHIWKGDKWLYTLSNEIEAWNKYESLKKEKSAVLF